MSKLEIRGHVATIGYEDSNPFGLIDWASRCGAKGYTELVKNEFEIALITKEDRTRIEALGVDLEYDIPICTNEEELINEDISGEVVVLPLTDISPIGEGDIATTNI